LLRFLAMRKGNRKKRRNGCERTLKCFGIHEFTPQVSAGYGVWPYGVCCIKTTTN
jgi:hypothetical protein